MSDVHTRPARESGFPVRAVSVQVTAGPDQGGQFVAQGESLSVGTADGNDIVLSDPKVSRYHLELRAMGDRIAVIDRGSTNGTQIGAATVRDGKVTVPAHTEVAVGDTTLRLADGGVVILELHKETSLAGLVGRAPAMRALMARIERLAHSDVPVMVLGESGTGKELIARAIHDFGPRKEGPFVTVDCAALTPNLFASELFGHEKGAFTGADRRHLGAFERAHNGTLFLDELGELPEAQQSSLLGTIERGRVRRVGGSDEVEVNVRLVSATHRDLRSQVNAGSFRLDLYYRLAVVLLHVPPLRERPEDIPLLVEHFLRDAGHNGARDALFPAAALRGLSKHPWMGNVRELRNVVLRTLATGEEPTVDPPLAVAGSSGQADPVGQVLELPYKRARRGVLDHFEVRYLRHLLERTDSVRHAAREAEMDRSYLTELLKRHGLV